MTHALVVGASGLVGGAVSRRLLTDGWRVTGVSRRTPQLHSSAGYHHLALDLLAPEAGTVLSTLDHVTHLVYAAVWEKPGLVASWSDSEQMRTNEAMLAAVLRPLAGRLRHATVLQGTKAYGVHLHPIAVPARERHPRDDHANFYWLQEDLLRSTAEEHGFDWTILRPVGIVGPVHGVGYNTAPVIGALAAVCHETGLPFGFPGGLVFPARQVVDSRLVADAVLWAATSPAAAGQHFNLTNGEVFSWRDIWPVLGEIMGVATSDPVPRALSSFIPEHAQTWERVVERHGLLPLSILDVVGQSHQYADYTFGHGATETTPPALVSSVKIKQAGFTQVRDTEETFRYALDALVAQRVLPDLHRGTRR